MKTLLLLSFTIPLFIMSSNANAFRGQRGDHMQKVMKELNLTDDQKQKIQASKKAMREKMKNVRSQLKEKRKAMQEALKNGSSESVLRTKHNEMQTIKRTVADARFDNMIAILNILNSDQKKKFLELKSKMQDGRKMRHHRGEDLDE